MEHRRDLAEENWLDLEHSVHYLMWMQRVGLTGDFLSRTGEVPVSNLGHSTGHPDYSILWSSSVPPGKFQDTEPAKTQLLHLKLFYKLIVHQWTLYGLQ